MVHFTRAAVAAVAVVWASPALPPARAAAQEAARSPSTSSLAFAESLLAAGDTAAAESAAATVLREAHGRDAPTWLEADRLLQATARERAKTHPELAAARYDRLTGRAEAESLYFEALARDADRLAVERPLLGERDLEELRRQLDSLGVGKAERPRACDPQRPGSSARGLFAFSGGGVGHPDGRGAWRVLLTSDDRVRIAHEAAGRLTEHGEFVLAPDEAAAAWALVREAELPGRSAGRAPFPDEVVYTFRVAEAGCAATVEVPAGVAREVPGIEALLRRLEHLIERLAKVEVVL